MLPFLHENLEQSILEHLQSGPMFTTALLRMLKKQRPQTTKQGMYAALRKLLAAEIVLKHKKQVSLNIAWLAKVESFTALAEHYYKSAERTGSFLGLADGEKIKYEFRNLLVTDAFWNHVVYLLIETHSHTPWFSYNPHCWFFLARPGSERAIRDFMMKKDCQYLITVGNATPLDRYIRKEFDGVNSQYDMRHSPLFQHNNYYVSCIKDFIVEVWIAPEQAKAIERVYVQQGTDTVAEAETQLQAIIHAKGKTRLMVSRNDKKAEKLRKKLAKSFYLPKTSSKHLRV